VIPDTLDAPWSLAGPDGYSGSGSGDSTLAGMTPGSYTVTWGDVTGWIKPAGQTNTLGSDEVLTFSGTYTEEGATPPGFVLIPAGTFTMGSPLDELGAYSDEHPQHSVHLGHAFYLQTKEVTNQQYLEMAQWAVDHGRAAATDSSLVDVLQGSTEELLDLDAPSCEIAFSSGTFSLKDVGHGINPDHPVQNVTWYGAVAYCDWLSMFHGIPRAYDHDTWECNGNNPYVDGGYRLPTEAEWEYACRSGASTAFANGPITERFCGFDPVLDAIGWYCGNSGGWSHPGGQKAANAWGLYDMHGNVWEWCNDWYRDDQYSSGENTNPVGPTSGTRRVLRGGNWLHGAETCRCADRDSYQPVIRQRYIGFRVAKAKL
jgi:formylglycine-generating enzyme required for sulfatase activity